MGSDDIVQTIQTVHENKIADPGSQSTGLQPEFVNNSHIDNVVTNITSAPQGDQGGCSKTSTCTSTAKVMTLPSSSYRNAPAHISENFVQSPAKVISTSRSVITNTNIHQTSAQDIDISIQGQDTLILDKKCIPDHIWDQRTQCQNYQDCVQQSGILFGFVPLTPLKLYHGPTVHWSTIPDIVQAHKIVAATGLPNFMAARLPVQSQLNIENWKKFLSNYWDKQLIDLLNCGFPLDFDRSLP